MLVYVPPTITYFYGFKRTLIRVDIIDNHHFSKSGLGCCQLNFEILATIEPQTTKKKELIVSLPVSLPNRRIIVKNILPKQRKKISKRSYKRKFWSILKKAGERFGKNGTWKGLNTSHPARVAYRKYARVGKPVPGGIKSELKSMGLLT